MWLSFGSHKGHTEQGPHNLSGDEGITVTKNLGIINNNLISHDFLVMQIFKIVYIPYVIIGQFLTLQSNLSNMDPEGTERNVCIREVLSYWKVNYDDITFKSPLTV